MEYRYTNILEYLPVRYSANAEQLNSRRTIYALKDGYCPASLMQKFTDKLLECFPSLRNGNGCSDLVVLFIPASSQAKTNSRYSALARHIQSTTGVRATLDGIRVNGELEASHLSGRREDKTSHYTFDASVFRGKTVVLIDDVITSGRSFITCTDRLMALGASNVVGLFAAKTVNPDWNRASA